MVPHLRDYLDAPVLQLQAHVAIGDIYGPTDIRLRLFGGGLADVAGEDYTNRAIDPLLNPEAKAAGGAAAWAAVRHPAGYRTLLKIKTANGYVLECHSISLPLLPPVGVPFCIITLLQLPDARIKLARENDNAFVSSHELQSWIDIGAGVPTVNIPIAVVPKGNGV